MYPHGLTAGCPLSSGWQPSLSSSPSASLTLAALAVQDARHARGTLLGRLLPTGGCLAHQPRGDLRLQLPLHGGFGAGACLMPCQP